MQHRLYRTGILDPAWFQMIRRGEQQAVAINTHIVDLAGTRLEVADPTQFQLTPGQQVIVWFAGEFYGQTQDERDAQIQRYEEERQQAQEEKRTKLNRLRQDAEAFNVRIQIPIPWVPGFKAVLSGLSGSSWGDGRNKATVEHILLLEDLQQGKLCRKRGDFLCSSSPRDTGKRWVTPESYALDGDGKQYRPKVTCQRCLNIVARWHDTLEKYTHDREEPR